MLFGFLECVVRCRRHFIVEAKVVVVTDNLKCQRTRTKTRTKTKTKTMMRMRCTVGNECLVVFDRCFLIFSWRSCFVVECEMLMSEIFVRRGVCSCNVDTDIPTRRRERNDSATKCNDEGLCDDDDC